MTKFFSVRVVFSAIAALLMSGCSSNSDSPTITTTPLASTTSAETCTMAHTITGNTVTFQISAASGGTVSISSMTTDGNNYSSVNNPFSLTYATTGTKTVTATASVNGVPCNSTGTVTDALVVGTASTSTLTCNFTLNPTASPVGYYVNGTVTAPGAVLPITFVGLGASPNTGITAYATSSTTASILFTYRGTYSLLMVIQDASGRQASCGAIQTVY